MNITTRILLCAVLTMSFGLLSAQAMANDGRAHINRLCRGLPSHGELTQALRDSVAPTSDVDTNGGFDLNMWATVVNRDGVVCAVTFSGVNRGSQWPGSRVISAQKANTANAFSLDDLALSTANLYSAVQPGGSLFGLAFSNPVDPSVAYGRDGSPPGVEGLSARRYGTRSDPLVGDFIGGVNVFGGGLALYNSYGDVIGGVGVSGDTSCADHNVSWRVRENLSLDNVPGGVGPNGLDGISYLEEGEDPNGFKHPQCGLNGLAVAEEIGSGGIAAP